MDARCAAGPAKSYPTARSNFPIPLGLPNCTNAFVTTHSSTLHTHGNKVRKMIYFFSAWPWETSFWGGFPRGGDSNGQKKLEDVRKCHRGHKTSIMSDKVFENYRKSLIRQYERSELRLLKWDDKSYFKECQIFFFENYFSLHTTDKYHFLN